MELIVVIIIMAILSQIGLVSWNRYTRRARAFAAQTAIRNIKTECEANRDLGVAQTYTPLIFNGYSIQAQNSNSCLGESGSGVIAAIPNNQDEYPAYFYNFEEGTIGCNYSSTRDNLFPECNIRNQLESNNSVIKDTFIQRDCRAYVLVKGPTWQEADSNARSLGGDLASVDNVEDKEWLTKEFSKERYSYEGDTNSIDPETWTNLWIAGERPGEVRLGHWNHDKNDTIWATRGDGDGTMYWDNNGGNGVSNNTRGIAAVSTCK